MNNSHSSILLILEAALGTYFRNVVFVYCSPRPGYSSFLSFDCAVFHKFQQTLEVLNKRSASKRRSSNSPQLAEVTDDKLKPLKFNAHGRQLEQGIGQCSPSEVI